MFRKLKESLPKLVRDRFPIWAGNANYGLNLAQVQTIMLNHKALYSAGTDGRKDKIRGQLAFLDPFLR